MKLCDRTLTILKNFSEINQSILITKGSTLRTIRGNAASNNIEIFARAEVPEKFPEDFAIFDLPQFLQGIGNYSDHVIEWCGGYAEILDADREGDTAVFYAADSATIRGVARKDLRVDTFDVEFDLKGDDFKALKRWAATYDVGEIAFVGDGAILYAMTADAHKQVDAQTRKKSQGYIRELQQHTEKEFRTVFSLNRLNLLADDYHVGIVGNEMGVFASKDVMYAVRAEIEVAF